MSWFAAEAAGVSVDDFGDRLGYGQRPDRSGIFD
jgi:hypothetical protein